MDIVGREPLRHNELNAVTTSIDKVETADGRMLVCKRIGQHKPAAPDHWLASDDPRHWNWWRREADAYASAALRDRSTAPAWSCRRPRSRWASPVWTTPV